LKGGGPCADQALAPHKRNSSTFEEVLKARGRLEEKGVLGGEENTKNGNNAPKNLVMTQSSIAFKRVARGKIGLRKKGGMMVLVEQNRTGRGDPDKPREGNPSLYPKDLERKGLVKTHQVRRKKIISRCRATAELVVATEDPH